MERIEHFSEPFLFFKLFKKNCGIPLNLKLSINLV